MLEHYLVMKRDELETEEKSQTAEHAVSMPTMGTATESVGKVSTSVMFKNRNS